MKQIYFIIFDLIFINVIIQIYGQISPKSSFILSLNYSSQDNKFYIQLNSNKNIIPKNFILDTTYSSTAFLCNDVNLINLPYNTSDNNVILINSRININNIINKDKNTIAELITLNTDIECILNKTNFFKNKNWDKHYGVLGLNNGNNTIIDTLYNLQIIKEKIFSICLSKNNGYFGLGGNIGIDTYLQNGQEIYFIDILPSTNNFFELKINSIKIDNLKFENEYTSILDTSEIHTYLPKILYEQIVANVLVKKNYLEKDLELGFCSIINEEEENNFYFNFPDIHFNFENYNFIWKPKNYFYKYKTIYNEHEIKLCFSFKELSNSDSDNKIILGTDFMIEHEIIFDKNTQQIAFINTNCDSLLNEDNVLENYNITSNSSLIKDNNNVNDNIDDSEEEKEKEKENEKEKGKEKENVKEKENEKEKEKEKLKEKGTEKLEEKEKGKGKEKIIEKEKEKGIEKEKVKEKEKENEKENIKKEKEEKTEIKKEKSEREEENKELTYRSYRFETSDIITTEINDISSDLSREENYSDNITNLLKSAQNLENIKENTTSEITNLNITQKIINISSTENNELYNTTQLNQNIDIKKEVQTTEATIKEETTIITERIKIIPTTIMNIPTTTKYIQTTEIIEENKDKNKNISDININNTEIKENNLIMNNETNSNNQAKKKNTFFGLVKSFLKNKLIYFILAFISVILCLVAIIMISCVIISCVKYCKRKRRDYVEQIDVEVQKYSKANSSFSG